MNCVLRWGGRLAPEAHPVWARPSRPLSGQVLLPVRRPPPTRRSSPGRAELVRLSRRASGPGGNAVPPRIDIRRANRRRQPGTPGGDAESVASSAVGFPTGLRTIQPAPTTITSSGLVGLFICVSLRDQFEVVMRMWMNGGAVAGGLGRTRDPLTGNKRRVGWGVHGSRHHSSPWNATTAVRHDAGRSVLRPVEHERAEVPRRP